ncbi:MAG: hypothetical protein IJ336_09285 [Lachnospiraceae bacterium]|nr:hypothetical protein [Lachnospiraceae bacterium]
MKRKTVCRMLTMMLALSMVVAPMSGCRGLFPQNQNTNGSVVGSDAGQTSESDITDDEVMAGATDLLSHIKNDFAASELPEDYNQPMYNLPIDHVFEFECCEEIGNYPNEAFTVVDNTDFVNKGGMTFNWNTYEDGKITVEPRGALYLDKNGSSNINDGTWGSLNVLYLVQKVDLTTGETLEKPIITPFTVQQPLQAPIISQGVDENNNYTISWEAVPGAVEYRVY